jgi:hypothetical protein
MPFTTIKGLSVQSAGTNNNLWGAGNPGNDLNTGVIFPIDTMVSGVSSFGASGNVTLSATDVQQGFFRFSGSQHANITVSPAAGNATNFFQGFFYFENTTTGGFTITVSTAIGSCLLPNGFRGCFFVDPSFGPRVITICSANNPTLIPLGTVTNWFAALAPTGWTQVTTPALSDSAIQIVIDGSGGTTGGTLAFSTVFARQNTDAYTLQLADIPSHNHPLSYSSTTNATGVNSLTVQSPLGTGTGSNIQNAGSGTGHFHGLDMRVNYSTWLVASYTG